MACNWQRAGCNGAWQTCYTHTMAHSNGSKRGHKRPRGGDMKLLGSMPGASSASGVLAQDSSAAVVPGLLAARHKVLSRKQRRKAARDEAKRARARAHQQKAARKAEAVAGVHNGEQGKDMQKKRKKRNKNKKKHKQQRQQQQQQHMASAGSDSDGSDDGQAAASRKRQRTRAPQAQAQQASPVLPPDDEDPEDAEIRRLEALLGISKGSGKGASNSRRQAYRQARKEFMEDGFEPDFVDFLADLDGIDKRPTPSAEEARAAAEAGSSASDDDAPEEISRRLPPEPANDDDDDEDEDEDEDDAEARARARTPATDKGVRVRDGSAAAAAGDGSAASDSEASDGSEAGVEDHSVVVKLAQQRRQRKQQHLYGNQSESSDSSDGEEADEAAAGGAAAGSGAYVPPHLRKRAGRTKAKQVMDRTAVVQRLRRRVQGVINRLSQANVQPMVKELVGLYADPSNSHREITDALRHIIMTSCCNTTQVASTPAVWWRGAFADHVCVCFVVSLSLHASPCHPSLCCMLSW